MLRRRGCLRFWCGLRDIGVEWVGVDGVSGGFVICLALIFFGIILEGEEVRIRYDGT